MIELSEQEQVRLARRITDDYNRAMGDHGKRIEKFTRYANWAKAIPEQPESDDQANFRVPVIQSRLLAKWAQWLDSIYGDGATIGCKPVGSSDAKAAAKVGCFMHWRFFDSMKAMRAGAIYAYNILQYGRAIAYCPWVRKTYKVPGVDPLTGAAAWKDEVMYEGPDFQPLHPDEIVVPAEDVLSIQDFSWVIRRVRVTPQQLLDGERAGKYEGIQEDFERILRQATLEGERGNQGVQGGDDVKRVEDAIQGVNKDTPTYDGRGKVLMLEWYGKRRLPSAGAEHDPDEWDVTERDLDETEMVVRFLPGMNKIIGVEDLRILYQRCPRRRPFEDGALYENGEYWTPGLPEMLEAIEDEQSALHNLFQEAGELSVFPTIFYRPGSGYDPKKQMKYGPRMMVPTEDPSSVKELKLSADFTFPQLMNHILDGWAEKLSGVSDPTMGLNSDRPNAPRTASGQLALIEQGNVRASLDIRFLKETFSRLIGWFWDLESEFGSPEQFFRVTEEDAAGLFDVKDGGATLTAGERGGKYDFELKFADQLWTREARKQKFLELYALLLQNPLIATNPVLLAQITQELCKQLGQDAVAHMIQVPDQDNPRKPREEWTLMLQGEDVFVHPMDNDPLHIMDHEKVLAQQRQLSPEQRDHDAEGKMVDHIIDHEQQAQKKKLMQAVASSIAGRLQQIQAMGGVPGNLNGQEGPNANGNGRTQAGEPANNTGGGNEPGM